MYVLVDESGFHKPTGKTTIALVYVTDYDALMKLDDLVTKIEEDLKIYPFHWSQSNWQVREKFVTALRKGKFTAKVAVTDNPVQITKFMNEALAHLVIERDIQKIIIDGKKPKLIERRFNKVLRDKGVSAKRVTTADDESQPGLRVADAIAGLVRVSLEKPKSPAASMREALDSKIDITLSIK